MVARTLDDNLDAAVAHGEALARDAADVRFPARRAVEGGVADDDIVLRREGRLRRRSDDDLAAGKALADVVVGVALQRERDALRHERAEALPAEPTKCIWIVSSGSPLAP